MNTVTQERVDSQIVKETTAKLAEKTTVVILTLKNGFEVVGTSACVDPANYDHEIGIKYARQRAMDKVWELEGYFLQALIHAEKELSKVEVGE